MNNGQMPPVQTYGQPTQYYTAEQVAQLMAPKKDNSGIIKTVFIILFALIAATFIGLFVWMNVEYNSVKEDVDGQVAVAVAAAKDEQAMQDEAEFLEREKYPYSTFMGPSDYGAVTFEYPKTWSVYVEKDAVDGKEFQAYLNPAQVDPVSKETVNALRVTIRNDSFDTVATEYQKAMDKKDSNLTVGTITVNGTVGNIYSGNIPNTEMLGYIVIFKVRDKTVVMQTDSVLFEEEFNKLINTVKFNA